jgi:hypothetical protein
MAGKRVLVIGLKPEFVDFTKFPGMTADKVIDGIAASIAQLNGLGYDAQSLLTDDGATAEREVGEALARRGTDCVVIGAGVRLSPEHFLLFEKLINAVHRAAPTAAICFNTQPSTTSEAVQRWLAP